MSSQGTTLSTSLPRVVRSFEDYAKVDFAIGDNDPVYFAIEASKRQFGFEWSTRFCVAMLAYYDMGVAVKAADYEGRDFWLHMEGIYPTAPRGNMRRHFRGDNGKNALRSMIASSLEPEEFFRQIPTDYSEVSRYCKGTLNGFGPMFALKIADYMDRCLDTPIRGMGCLRYVLPTNPKKAVEYLIPGMPVPDAFHLICKRVEALNLLAPPMYDRPVGPAEIETALCDWYGAKVKKNNWLGMDTIDKGEQLKGLGEKAEWMASHLPKAVKKSDFQLLL